MPRIATGIAFIIFICLYFETGPLYVALAAILGAMGPMFMSALSFSFTDAISSDFTLFERFYFLKNDLMRAEPAEARKPILDASVSCPRPERLGMKLMWFSAC